VDPFYAVVRVIARFWIWFFFERVEVRHPEPPVAIARWREHGGAPAMREHVHLCSSCRAELACSSV